MTEAAVAFLLLLALGLAAGVGCLLLLCAFVLVVGALARIGRTVRRVWCAASAWRGREWSPVTEARVRWASRRLDSRLDCLLTNSAPNPEHPQRPLNEP